MAGQNLVQHLSSPNDEMPIHKFIPMEKLDFIESNQVKILYYQTPSRFYLYLRQKLNAHAQLQIDLQRAMQNHQSASLQYEQYQPVVAQDNHAVWHRAIILDFNPNSADVRVYFVDFGQEETLSKTNIRPLPLDFVRQPAFAIPCRLFDIYPRTRSDQSTWKSDDPVHDEFNRLMANTANCKVCKVIEQICYDVQIDIPKVGDLGAFLLEKNLVSRITMQTSQPTIYNTNQSQSFGRAPPGFSSVSSSVQPPQRLPSQNDYYSQPNHTVQQPQTLSLSKPVVQQAPSVPLSTDSSCDIRPLPLQDGTYVITQVYSAVEFYGYSDGREKELHALQKYFADIYNNNNTNDQSISVHLLMEGTTCVIQHNDQFHRVVIQRRESESRVSVKLVDRGDEIIVDTSELLQLERKCLTVPAFAQPLRLYNYDKSHSTANITHKLKKLILNQRVQIIQHLPTIHGFYPVEVKLSDNQSVNQILLSNATIPINPPAPPPPPMRIPEIQTTKVQPEVNIQRTDDLPAPQKLLTASQPGRTQPGRFSAASQPVVNDPPSRFTRQQQDEPLSRPTNGNQPLATEQSHTFSREFTTNEDNGRVNNDEQRNGNTRGSAFADRAGRNGFHDRNFNRNNDDNENDNGGRRATRSDDRGGGFSGRGNRGGYNERNNYENRNENYGQRSGGSNNRGGEGGGFTERGGGGFAGRGGGGGFAERGGGGGFAGRGGGGGFAERGGGGGGFTERGGGGGFAGRGGGGGFAERGGGGGGGFAGRGGGGGFADRARSGVSQDRFNGNRNNYNDGPTENSNPQRSQGFASRGDFHGERERQNDGFSNYRGRGNDRYGGGDSGHRGGYSDRGGQRGGREGYRGGRNGGFGDQENNGFGSMNENNDSKKTFSGWPNVKPPTKCFEAGDHFTEHEIPQESFEFVISHIEAADDFFIQSYSKATELIQLTDRLQKESEVPLELNFQTLKIDQPCLAKSSDNCWYRASILSTDSNRTSVRFIDFGDTTDADAKTTQQLGKEFCSEPPYAYRCTLADVKVNTTIDKNAIIARCEGKQFHGKIEKTLSGNKYLLQSDDLQKLLIELKAIELKSNEKRKCVIVYIDQVEHQFYIQMNDEAMDKIDEHVADAGELSIDEIQVGSMVILTFDGAPARAIVQEDRGENVQVYFVDYGNKHVCPKTSLRQYREELKSYPYQAQRCELHNISSHDLNQAFTQLDGYLQSDQTEISIVHENTDVWSVRLYIDGECFNEKFPGESVTVEKNETSLETTSQSSATTVKEQERPTSATTVKEQERPTSATGKRNNEEILSPVGNSSSASSNIKRKKSESETEVNSTKYRTGTLTHIDKTQPIVYLQLIPDCESDLERINDFIDSIIVDNQHNSSYAVGDYVIAQFSEDYYRARVESYSSTTEQYTVYFLDYGNTDEVSLDHMLPCLDELKQIKAQTHKYSLENQTSQTWTTFVYPFLETKLNEVIEFYFSNDTQSSVHIKFDDNENQMYHQGKTYTANISGTNQDCFYIHIVPDADTLICEMDELLNTHSKEHRTSDQWQINDLSIVHDHDKEQYFRGKILSIDNDKYNVQCIDYGHILEDRSNDDLYVLSDDDLLKRTPIARQCRLFSVTNDNQIKAVEEVIKTIHANERVTVTLHSDHNDPCWSVMLFRQDNETVNDRYQSNDANQQNTDHDEQNDTLPDSAIGADDDTSNVDMPCRTPDQYLTSPIGVPQAESTHQYGDTANASVSNSSPSTSSMTINQTIDFGENDPSTSNTTLKDENENLSLN